MLTLDCFDFMSDYLYIASTEKKLCDVVAAAISLAPPSFGFLEAGPAPLLPDFLGLAEDGSLRHPLRRHSEFLYSLTR